MRSLNRRPFRPFPRRLTRAATRMTNGGPRPRPVNYLARALLAFQKVIRARRRLMRLAPQVFDHAVVDRETAARAATAARREEFRRAAAKIYGTVDAPSPPIDAPSTDAPASAPCPPLSPWPKSRRVRQAVLREMTAYDLWWSFGLTAFRQFQKRQPHARLSLSTIARLITVGCALGRLATGLETTARPDPVADASGSDFEAALRKIYGDSELTGVAK